MKPKSDHGIDFESEAKEKYRQDLADTICINISGEISVDEELKEKEVLDKYELNFMESEGDLESFMKIDEKRFSLGEIQSMLHSTS